MMLTKTHNFTRDGKPHRIHVEYGWNKIGNQASYFSVTGAIYRGKRMEPDCCGAIHDEIRKLTPSLIPLLAYHLTDFDAQPMHYIANAVYWAELASGTSEYQERNEIPRGYASFEEVFMNHCNPIDDQDREELRRNLAGFRLSVNNGVKNSTAAIDLRQYLTNRIPKMQTRMRQVMEEFMIGIPVN